jgi:hypothetical protein
MRRMGDHPGHSVKPLDRGKKLDRGVSPHSTRHPKAAAFYS